MQNIVSEAERMLEERIFPFWHSLRDDVNGGFIGYMSEDLEADPEYDKGTILESRILWFFSEYAAASGSDAALSDAEHAYKFIKEHAIDREYGGVFWSVGFDGTRKDDAKHAYCQAFALYGLSSYYMLTGDKEALDEALSLYGIIEKNCTDETGYLEYFSRDWKLNEDNGLLSGHGVNAYRTMNTLLHIFEAYANLYRATKMESVASSMKRILSIYLEKVYCPEKRREEVYFDRDYRSLCDITSYGHDIESSWLIEEGAALLGDEKLSSLISQTSSQMARNVLEKAFLDNGAVINECVDGHDDLTRIWWIQAEAVQGFLNEYWKSHDPKLKEAALSVWNYITEYFADKREGGEWFWAVSPSDEPLRGYPVVDPWKCPYHNGRLCLNIIKNGDRYGLQ